MAQFDHPGIVRYNSTWIEKPPEEWQVSNNKIVVNYKLKIAHEKNMEFQYQADEEMLGKLNSSKRQWVRHQINSPVRRNVQMSYKPNRAFIYIQMQETILAKKWIKCRLYFSFATTPSATGWAITTLPKHENSLEWRSGSSRLSKL